SAALIPPFAYAAMWMWSRWLRAVIAAPGYFQRFSPRSHKPHGPYSSANACFIGSRKFHRVRDGVTSIALPRACFDWNPVAVRAPGRYALNRDTPNGDTMFHRDRQSPVARVTRSLSDHDFDADATWSNMSCSRFLSAPTFIRHGMFTPPLA